MKNLLTILTLVLSITVLGQSSGLKKVDCLEIIKLKFQFLDSNVVKAIEYPLTNSKFQNILSYSSKNHIRLAYFTTNRNKWISFELPFSEETNDFKFINIEGKSKLIVKGMVGNSENRGRSVHKTNKYMMLILNIDKEPTQILKVIYGCDEAEIANDGAKNAPSYFHKYERKIEVNENGLIITTPDKKEYSFEGCVLSEIEDGTYIFEGTGIKKAN